MWPLLLIAACTPDPVDTGCSGEAVVEIGASVEAGDGDDEWVEAAENSAFTIIHGPQGGWHMLAAVRVENTADIVTLAYSITLGDGGPVVSDNSYRVQLAADGECSGVYTGMYGFLDVSDLEDGEADTPPEILGGQTLVITMTATDLDGRVATDTLHVVGALDPQDL